MSKAPGQKRSSPSWRAQRALATSPYARRQRESRRLPRLRRRKAKRLSRSCWKTCARNMLQATSAALPTAQRVALPTSMPACRLRRLRTVMPSMSLPSTNSSRCSSPLNVSRVKSPPKLGGIMRAGAWGNEHLRQHGPWRSGNRRNVARNRPGSALAAGYPGSTSATVEREVGFVATCGADSRSSDSGRPDVVLHRRRQSRCQPHVDERWSDNAASSAATEPASACTVRTAGGWRSV